MTDGILVLDKPQGWTSHDVVAKVRRLTGIRRVGHTGTLDPMATGVLILCVGRATRVAEYMAGHDKRYTATIHLGVETDTYDAHGQAVLQQAVDVSEADLRGALQAFVGEIRQVPPMFSAIKQNGRKLYTLARQGIQVAREPRAVKIYAIDAIAFDLPHVTVDVRCSAGTYMRSLAHDLGQVLGCGAYLADLRRTASGEFTLDQAIPLDALEMAVTGGTWAALLHPLDAALRQFPALTLNPNDARRAQQGLALAGKPDLAADFIRAYDQSGQLIGLLHFDRTRNELRPGKILAGER